jgi:hypothetical protein
MKIHQSITERGGRALARTALVVTCAFAALVPFASSALAERSAAGPAPFKNLEEQLRRASSMPRSCVISGSAAARKGS